MKNNFNEKCISELSLPRGTQGEDPLTPLPRIFRKIVEKFFPIFHPTPLLSTPPLIIIPKVGPMVSETKSEKRF